MDKVIAILVLAVISWFLYVGVVYRLTHPDLTETQLQLKVFSFGLYDPYDDDKLTKKE